MTSTVEEREEGGINFARLLMSFGPLLFLASDLSAHISGAVLAIDGAMGAMAAIPPAFIKTLKGQ